MSLLVLAPTRTSATHPPPHAALVDPEDADALARVLFPPLEPDAAALNRLLGRIGTAAGTVAFAQSLAPGEGAFHHVTCRNKRTVVFSPPGVDTVLVLTLDAGTEPQGQIERAIDVAWSRFRLLFGPDAWDSSAACDWWQQWTARDLETRAWIAGSDAASLDVLAPPDALTAHLQNLQTAVTSATRSPSPAAYAVALPTVYHHGPSPAPLIHHLIHLVSPPTPPPTPAAPTPGTHHASKWTTLHLGSGAASPTTRWPSLSLPTLSRPPSTHPPPPAKGLASWLGFTTPASTHPDPAPRRPSPQVASIDLPGLDDALADAEPPPARAEWHVQHVWVTPEPIRSPGSHAAMQRYVLAYTIPPYPAATQTLLAVLLDTPAPLRSLAESLNATHASELTRAIHALTHHLSPTRPPHPPTTTEHIHRTHTTHSEHLCSAWVGERVIAPAPGSGDGRAGRGRRRAEVTVDQAAGAAKQSLIQ